MLAAGALTTFASTWLIVALDGQLLASLLGAALIFYAIYGLLLRPVAIPPRWEALASPAVGVLTGGATGATGVSVVPAVPYLQSVRLSREDLVQSLGLSFTVSTLALAAGLAARGALEFRSGLESMLLVVPAFAGMAVGEALRRRMSAQVFRYGFYTGLLALGLELARRFLR